MILVRLAAAFNLTLAGLMLRAEGQGQRLVRSSEQPVWRDPETGYLRKQVFSRPDHPVEIVRVELPAGQKVTLPASSYAHIRQIVWVQKGSLVITRPASGRFSARATASVLVRRRKRPSPTKPFRPALTSSHWRGADIVQGNILGIRIAPLTASPEIRAALSALLIETVASGGSVSFMHPLAPHRADAFWQESLAAADRGERIVLGAFDQEHLIATVTLLLNLPPNQPHRAEIAKMMTKLSHRGRGVARALLREAETIAVARGRTLLVLDTAIEEGASWLYERVGFTLSGIIPDYALKPHGGLVGTMIYWKRIGEAAA